MIPNPQTRTPLTFVSSVLCEYVPAGTPATLREVDLVLLSRLRPHYDSKSTALHSATLRLTSLFQSTAQQIIYGMQEAVICAESSVVRDLLEAGRIVSPSLGKSDDNPLVLPYSKEDVEIILSHCFFPA